MEETLPELAVGQVVRVYRVHLAEPVWLMDAETGQYLPGRDNPEVGRVLIRDDTHYLDGARYRVTVLRAGREYHTDWYARYWLRLSHEPPPAAGGQ